MPPSMFAIYVAGSITLGGLVTRALRARRERRQRQRRVRGVPRVTAASAREGQPQCVVGELVGPFPLVAPFTGRPCALWWFEVEVASVGGQPQWERCGGERSERHAFTLRDATGRVDVDPAGAELVIVRDGGLRVLAIDASLPAGLAWLAEHGHRVDDPSLFARRYRVREGALSAEDPIAVVGVGVREPDRDAPAGERGYRDAVPTVLRFSSAGTHRLYITDDPEVTR